MAILMGYDKDNFHADPEKEYRGCYKKNWSRERISWLAGLLEGEGCFKVGKHRNRNTRHIRIEVVSTDRDILEKCHEIIRAGHIYVYPHRKYKTQYRYSVASEGSVIAVMFAIYPFMGARRRLKIRECIDAWKEKPSRLKIAFGKAKPIGQWAKDPRCIVSLGTLKSRTSIYGWPIEKAMTQPIHQGRRA